MKLFIGNATRQVMDFRYRDLETMAPRSQKIQPGSQIKISGDLTTEMIDHVINQHDKYGMVAETKIDQARAFHGTCYAINQPITATRLVYLMDGNIEHLVKRGNEIRRTNAVAHSEGVNNVLRRAEREEIPVLELTVQQERHDPSNSVPQMSEGILVSPDADAQPLSGRGRRRAA